MRRLRIDLGEGHVKDEDITFELEGGENYLAQNDSVSDCFHVLIINILRLFS